ncbi:Proteasome subunit family protein [Leishmania donovani]|uniref:Dihydropteridine reductase n=1 Tax=Leishmania donovani TaxID=5661 RepID=A0A504XKM9_LEIDO|nr:Proteasome subunit family protein [Leishmania donovani]
MKNVLLIGACGALGRAVANAFAKGKWSIISVDQAAAVQQGDGCGAVNPASSIEELQQAYKSAVTGLKVDAVINNCCLDELMLRQSLFSSVAAAHVFSTQGEKDGLLLLTGAAAALSPTPGMIGYGTAKSAVHFLCQSIAADPSVLPTDASVLAILPTILDTPGNRSAMPHADRSTWTSLEDVAQQIVEWSNGSRRPASGSLVKISLPLVTAKMASGGSVIAIKYNGGVLMAADTLLSYGYADFQMMTKQVEDNIERQRMYHNVDELSPSEVFSYLHRSIYQKRCDFEPCLCQMVFIGFRDSETFLAGVDDVGTRWEDDCVATGYGAYIALPLLRQALEKNPSGLSRAQAVQILTDCLRVLFYRECRTINKFQMADAASDGVRISEPFDVETNWEYEGFCFEKTAIIR